MGLSLVRRAGIAVVAFVATVTGVAGPASAVAAPIHLAGTGGQGVYLRSTPSMSATHVGWMPEGASPDFQCWVIGPYVGTVRYWFKVRHAGVTGYYPSYYDDSHYSSGANITAKYGIPECGAASAPAPTVAPAPPKTSPSSAPGQGTYIHNDAGVRPCVDLAKPGCAVRWTIPKNTPVTMVCWMKGTDATEEYRTNMWFVVRAGDREGFVHASRVIRQTHVDWCGNDPSKKAVINATAWLGQRTATASVAALFTRANWGSRVGEWSGDCPKLGNAAWMLAGRTPLRGDAIEQYRAYSRGGRVHTSGTPPMGALVFFDVSRLGHVALSIGGGNVITTRGNEGDNLPVEIRRVGDYPNYLGWAMP